MHQTITIVGRLGRDPEMRYTPGGDPVTSFNIATDRVFNDRNGVRAKETTWFRVSVFGKQAETCNQYLAKGKIALVEGRLRVDPKTGGPTTFTRQDGTVGASFEIAANVIRFLSARDDQAEDGNPGARGAVRDDQADDVPF